MPEYRFAMIVAAAPLTHEEILDAADALGNAGCIDASICGHSEGLELLFERAADSLQAAMSSAVSDVESAGYRVARLEMDRQCMPV